MARKSRKNMNNVPVTTPETSLEIKRAPFRAALYARLSFETEYAKESDTLDTQIALMKNFVEDSDDIVVADIYSDASVSGTSFNRPEFDRMMNDIKAGRVNMVITKDLSRLGRNYLETGNFIERVFPFLHVRYYAITDDFDSFRTGTDLMMPLKNIVNEYYTRDLSKKVHSGYMSTWKQGNHSAFIPPYGYKKDESDPHRLLINDETAPVVQRIYRMFLDDEMSYADIARVLKAEGIPSPSEYNQRQWDEIGVQKRTKSWYWRHVVRILESHYNVGDNVHRKTKRIFGNRKLNTDVPREEWVIISDTHEALISREVFEKTEIRMEEIRLKKSNDMKKKAEYKRIHAPENLLKERCKCGICGRQVGMYNYRGKYEFVCKHSNCCSAN